MPVRPWNLPTYRMKLGLRLTKENLDMKMRWFILLLLAFGGLAASASAGEGAIPHRFGRLFQPPARSVSTAPPLPDLTYVHPTQKTKLRNYLFDAFGPYPIVGAGLAAGINQAYKTSAGVEQGAEGYGKRFGSDLGIAAITTTTRYALSQALREDTLYYRCECKGVFPRLKHAVHFDLYRTPRRSMAIVSFLSWVWSLRMPAP
jgi:hypothetical protein